ncbi:hypothetical protein BH10PLA2_BH10PLA2_24250 [soil metagenome]
MAQRCCRSKKFATRLMIVRLAPYSLSTHSISHKRTAITDANQVPGREVLTFVGNLQVSLAAAGAEQQWFSGPVGLIQSLTLFGFHDF